MLGISCPTNCKIFVNINISVAGIIKQNKRELIHSCQSLSTSYLICILVNGTWEQSYELLDYYLGPQ